MKLYRNTTLAIVTTLLFTLTFSSCTYEDGPSISLRTKKGRLTGEWEAKFIGGEQITSGESYELEFEGDGDVTVKFSFSDNGFTFSGSEKGEWEWADGKESLEVTLDGSKEEWKITRLTNKELEFEDEDNEKYEFEKK